MRMTATGFTIATALFLAMSGSAGVLAQETGCQYDKQCKGERICEKGACVSPTLPKDFPPNSTGRPLGGSPVIQTTREECERRGGVHRPTNDPEGSDQVRCALPPK